jgi:superfamily II DNA or RNA helicase
MSEVEWYPTVMPRKWQLDALDKWQGTLRGIVSVVTGGGKTLFAELCMLRYKQMYSGVYFVIIVPTLSLLDQWYVSLREDLSVPDDQIATYSGDGKADKPKQVNLLVLNTAREIAPRLARLGRTFLIVDECHRAASPINAKALVGPYHATLGLSATPERQYDSGFEEYLVPTLGEIIVHYDYNQALSDGVISKFNLINVEVDLTSHEKDRYGNISQKIGPLVRRLNQGEPTGDQLKRLLMQRASVAANARMRVPATLRIVASNPGARTLVFHERISAAEELRDLLVARGMNATIYHSRLAAVTRRDNLRLFRRGIFDVMVSCRALDEGTNVPETTVAVIASSTASTRQRIQRLGRVLRPAPGKDSALVYTIYATQVEQERLAREAASLTGAESVTWLRMRLAVHGKDSNSR